MIAILTMIVCVASNPVVCETIFPNSVRADGQPMTFFECLGVGGQSAAIEWASEHPGYIIRRIQCSISNDQTKTRERLQTPEA